MADLSSLAPIWPDLALLALVAFSASLARGFSGFGAALIFMPLASALLGPKVAAPVLLVTDTVMTIWMVPPALKSGDRGQVGVMVLGALIGVPLGTWALAALDPLTLRWGIVVGAGAMLVLLLSGWRYHGRPRAPFTVAVGAISGLFSGAAQIGGPPVVAYWLGASLPAAKVRANIVLFFLASSLISTTGYLWTGIIGLHSLALSALIAPVYGLGAWAGAHMFGLASERTFRRISLAMIAVATVTSMPILDGLLRG